MGRHVAIIGAGAVGVISAIEALREGHRVTLIDPGPSGGEIGGDDLMDERAVEGDAEGVLGELHFLNRSGVDDLEFHGALLLRLRRFAGRKRHPNVHPPWPGQPGPGPLGASGPVSPISRPARRVDT